MLRSYIKKKLDSQASKKRSKRLNTYLKGNRVPWSEGYNEFKEDEIGRVIRDSATLSTFASCGQLEEGFGKGIDERIVEYPYIFSRIPDSNELRMLDAGSTFNFPQIVSHESVKSNELTIYTFHPEENDFQSQKISYVFGDLREVPFRDNHFDLIVCQSTIEHIDMDNSIYGYDVKNSSENQMKSFEYLKAIHELIRILKSGGKLLLTFPYGKYENHGFFQQFDAEMLNKLKSVLDEAGTTEYSFFRYRKQGWNFAGQKDCDEMVSFNPHTGKGKGDDGAAHCRSVCCLEFDKA